MLNLTQSAGLALSTLAVTNICTKKKDESISKPKISVAHPIKSAEDTGKYVSNLKPVWKNIFITVGATVASYVSASIVDSTTTSNLDVSAYAENLAAVSTEEELDRQLHLLDAKCYELELVELSNENTSATEESSHIHRL